MNTHRPNRPRLSFETLESREMMALDYDLDGAGRVIRVFEDGAGQTGAAVLLVQADGRLNMRDGAVDLGTFKVARNLSVSLSKLNPELVNVLQLDGHTLKTNLNVTLGETIAHPLNPATQFQILGGRIDVAGTGTIDGNVRAAAGAGSQWFIFGQQERPLPHVTNITGSLDVDLGPGGESGSLPPNQPEVSGSVGSAASPAFLHVGGNVHVKNSTIFVIAGSVGGNLIVESPNKVGTIPFLGSPGQLVTLGNFGRPLSIGGNVHVQTGGGADSISAENATIHGNLFVQSEAGDDYLEMGNRDHLNDPNGNLAFILAPARVDKNVFLSLGEGNDRLDLGDGDLVARVQFSVGGNLFVFGEEGNDAVRAIELKLDQSVILIDTGEGEDAITLERINAARAHLFVLLGSGDDVFTVSNTSTLALETFFADGGTDVDELKAGNLDSYSFRKKLRRFEI